MEQLSIGIEVTREVVHAVVIQRGRRAALAHYRHAARADATSTAAFINGLFDEFVDDEATALSLVTTTDADDASTTTFAADVKAIQRSCAQVGVDLDGPVELQEPVDREIPPELTTLSTSIDAEASVALRAAWKVAKSTTSTSNRSDKSDSSTAVSPTSTAARATTRASAGPASAPPIDTGTRPTTAAVSAADTAKMARLQAEKTAIRTELQSLVLSRDNAQARAAELSTQVASISAQLATARAEMRTAGSERKVAEQEAEELRQRLQQVEQTYKEKMHGLRTGAAETRASAEGAISRLESELDVVRSELDLVRTDAQRDQRAILTDLEQSRLVADKRAVEIAALTDELQSTKDRLARTTDQVADLSATTKASVATAAELKAELTARIAELDAADEAIAELTEIRSGVERLRKANSDLEEQLARLRTSSDTERQKSSAHLGDLQAQLREVTEELEAARALAKARGLELERVGKSTRDLAADLAAAEVKIDEHTEREREHAVTAENARRLASDLAEATRRVTELERTTETDSARIRKADTELEEFRTRLKQQTIELDESQIVGSKHAAELESVRTTVSELNAELDALKAERATLVDDLAERQTKLDRLEAQLASNKEAQSTATAQVEKTERQLAERTSALEQLRRTAAAEREQAAEAAAKAKTDAADVQTQHEQTLAELEASHEQRLDELRTAVESAGLEVDRLRTEARAKGESLEAVERDYAKKLGDLEHSVALSEARGLELDALRAELESTQDDLDIERAENARQLAKARSTADEWAAEAERIVALAEAHASELREREQQLHVIRAANERLEAELESLQAGTAVRLRKLNEEDEKRQASISNLQAELATMRSELTVAKQMSDSRAEQNDELSQSIRELEREHAEIDATRVQKISELEAETAKLRNATSALDALDDDLQRLRTERETTVRQLQNEREQLARREADAIARVRELEAAAVSLARDTEHQVEAAYAAASSLPAGDAARSQLEAQYAAAHAELEANFQQAHVELQSRFGTAQAQYQQQLELAHAELRAVRSQTAELSSDGAKSASPPDEALTMQPPLMRPPPMRPLGG